MKILIIDDSLLDRRLLMKVISSSGITVEIVQASDGDEGLKILSQSSEEIALVLLDWQMPKMSGIEVLKAMSKNADFKKIPVIMITASASEDSRQMARDAHPDLAGYLVKPYKTERLIEMIRLWVK
ncbi:MAG TPA: response regulator [Candidatus Omnitrophota bacterium]|nr:response regulator [Candidatus Omnitrophota bacterium]HPN88448.1 response regulator [Candidatus Omnitrophota bacterium]